MNNIVRKLTSRKLWLAVAAFVSGLLTALGHKETAVTVTGLIMQGAAVIAYIVAEGLVDASNVERGDAEELPNKGLITVMAYDDYDEEGNPITDEKSGDN